MEDNCIICKRKINTYIDADFNPFIVERAWNGIKKETKIAFCPNCGLAFSLYRFSDDDVEKIYCNYRNDFYQKQKYKYDNYYTEQYNKELYAPADKGAKRKSVISDFLCDYIDPNTISNVLDYGGDKGQFIPDCFSKAHRYVYEISGNQVVNGVELIKETDMLKKIRWDLIMCNEVLEHVSDVSGMFAFLVNLLDTGSFLYIEVPSGKGIENNTHVTITEHINFFTYKTFDTLAKKNGLRVIKKGKNENIVQVLCSI